MFGMPKEYLLHTEPTRVLILHQIASGIRHGEFTRRTHEPWNKVHLQRSLTFSFDTQQLCFRPCDEVIEAILEVYRHNAACASLESRVRLDEVPLLCLSVECSLEVDRKLIQYPIFTKHPDSGTITNHLYPYTTLPRFTLRSADPGLLSIIAQHVSRLILKSVPPAELIPDRISQIPELWASAGFRQHTKGFWDEFATDLHTSRHPPNNQPRTSGKRKRTDDTTLPKPAKRARGCTTPEPTCDRRRHRVRAPARQLEYSGDRTRTARQSAKVQAVIPHVVLAPAAKPSMTLKRKRGALQIPDFNVDAPTTAKRTRRDFSTVVAPTRTVYARASKSKGVARMARIR
ncbi:hypothetical protein CYLTODRAFT_459674 [Cylindrobasidium torrendii FP15055 ss-10]|uniref:Uncharacterized protein n=1 Tax=Cylindrobasidium torrendii FP15055 ss-10 TaxID=1314674 RepID=A0A0D7AUX6_9AGAR|nr:hypothetical protein CYLTODRAFT_459674 [Cylindrobasidium torrendii FP15055 ss-10]